MNRHASGDGTPAFECLFWKRGLPPREGAGSRKSSGPSPGSIADGSHLYAVGAAVADEHRAERALGKRKMRKHFDLRIGTGSFSWKRKKQAIADEAALNGFYVVWTNVPEEWMSAAVVLTCKRLSRVERAFRTMKASDLQIRPIRHRREPRVRAHLLICMLAYYVEMRMREALAAGQAKGGRQTHELRRGRPRLTGTARATRNTHDEPDRALGAGKAGIRRPRLADAGPESRAAAAEREDPHAVAPSRIGVSSCLTAGIRKMPDVQTVVTPPHGTSV